MNKIRYDNTNLRTDLEIFKDKVTEAYNIKDGLIKALHEQEKRTDTPCYKCDKEFNEQDILKRHNELCQWPCLRCAECLKSNDAECCDK